MREIILDAAHDLLGTRGAHEVSATRIAEETGVARTTIYRQWPDQASLLLATIDRTVAPSYDLPDTGDLTADLRQTLTNLRHRLEVRPVRPIFAGLVDLASRDDAFVEAQQRFIGGLVQPTVDVLDNACVCGDLPADLDRDTAAATLTGPLLHEFLVMRHDIGDALIDAAMAQFMGHHALN